MAATPVLLEATGPDGTAVEASYIHLGEHDSHSLGPNGYIGDPISKRADGAGAFSCERWVRWRFDGTFRAISTFRFWAPGFVAPSGWVMYCGVATNWRTPQEGQSDTATRPLPTSQDQALDIGGTLPLSGSVVRYTSWVVLQAIVTGDADEGPMLPSPGITYELDWQEADLA